MREVFWTLRADADMDGIVEHIAQDNPKAARRVVTHIRKRAELLSLFPGLGRLGRVAGTRELVIVKYPYIVAYAVQPDRVVILSVQHGKQLWPDEF